VLFFLLLLLVVVIVIVVVVVVVVGRVVVVIVVVDHTNKVNGKPYVKLGQVGKGGSSKVYKVMGPDLQNYALKKVWIYVCILCMYVCVNSV